jgi:hypothetical protein
MYRILVEKFTGRNYFGYGSIRWRIILKWFLNE